MMMSYLPDDLEEEILSRLPTKSLWELQTTCKRWYALFRDPKFVENNNKKLGKAVWQSMLLSNFEVYSLNDDLHQLHNSSVDPSIEFTLKLSSLMDLKDLKISKIFPCEGLILCCALGNTKLVVWNPCTGQRMSIKPRTCYRWEDKYGLGYVSYSSHRSYKILRCCYYKNEENARVAEFEIYELSSGSWRVLDYFTHDYDVIRECMSLKGNTYWVAGDEETGLFMMKFDYKTERFVRLRLPFQSSDLEDDAVLSVVRDEKLLVLHILGWSAVMKIWVTNKIDDEAKDLSWRSDFVLVVDFDKFNWVTNVSSFILDEENKVAVCCDIDTEDEDMTTIYIVGEDMQKQVYKEITKPSCPHRQPLVRTYLPSFVDIHNYTQKAKKKDVRPSPSQG